MRWAYQLWLERYLLVVTTQLYTHYLLGDCDLDTFPVALRIADV